MLEPFFRFYGRRKGRSLKSKAADLMTTLLPQVLFQENDRNWLRSSQKYALEIGFGRGDHLIQRAQRHPDYLFIGAEAFQNGVAHLLKGIHETSLKNILIYPYDVRYLMPHLPEACLDMIFMLFPDPWPKKKHQKRRLGNEVFIQEILRVLKEGGEFLFASDDESYANMMSEIIKKKSSFRHFYRSEKKPEDWPWTRYNQKAEQAGRKSFYIQSFT